MSSPPQTTNQITDKILDYLSKLLSAHKLLSRMKPSHVEIFNTPATVVWVAKKDEYVPEVVKDKNVKKLKGNFDLKRKVTLMHFFVQDKRCTKTLMKYGRKK